MIYILFITSFYFLFSQENTFEEIRISYENGEAINVLELAYPFTKGDSIFIKVMDDNNNTLGMLSTDNGSSWRDIYPSIFVSNKISFSQAPEPHPLSFEFLKMTKVDDSLNLDYYDFDGNLIRSNKIKYDNGDYFINPINPTILVSLYNAYTFKSTSFIKLYSNYGKDISHSAGGVGDFDFCFSDKYPNIIYTFGIFAYTHIAPFKVLENFKTDIILNKKDSIQSTLNKIHFDLKDDDISLLPLKGNSFLASNMLLDNSNSYDTLTAYRIMGLNLDSINESIKDLDLIEIAEIQIKPNYFFRGRNIFTVFDFSDINNQLISITHSRKNKNNDEYLFKNRFFYISSDRGLTWKNFADMNFIENNDDIRNIALNSTNQKIYLTTISQNSKNKYRLLRSKKSITTKVESKDITNVSVYFTSNNLVVENNESSNDSYIQVFDIDGKVVFEQNYLLKKGTNRIALNSSLKANLYLVNITFNKSESKFYKLIKVE